MKIENERRHEGVVFFLRQSGTAHAKGEAGSTRARYAVGSKPSNIFQMDRPESGGADRKEEREASGLLDREKQKFAKAQATKKATDEQSAVGKQAAGGRGKRSGNRSRGSGR
ncbi:MAG: hypothetical protein ACXWM9_08415 [Gemmatimonadaceae bacterium]